MACLSAFFSALAGRVPARLWQIAQPSYIGAFAHPRHAAWCSMLQGGKNAQTGRSTMSSQARIPDHGRRNCGWARTRKSLSVAFESGERCELPAEYLRVKSPSAEVQGHSPDERKTVPGKRNVDDPRGDPDRQLCRAARFRRPAFNRNFQLGLSGANSAATRTNIGRIISTNSPPRECRATGQDKSRIEAHAPQRSCAITSR